MREPRVSTPGSVKFWAMDGQRHAKEARRQMRPDVVENPSGRSACCRMCLAAASVATALPVGFCAATVAGRVAGSELKDQAEVVGALVVGGDFRSTSSS